MALFFLFLYNTSQQARRHTLRKRKLSALCALVPIIIVPPRPFSPARDWTPPRSGLRLDTLTVKSAHQINICRGKVTCANASSDHRQKKAGTGKHKSSLKIMSSRKWVGKKKTTLYKFRFIKAYKRAFTSYSPVTLADTSAWSYGSIVIYDE